MRTIASERQQQEEHLPGGRDIYFLGACLAAAAVVSAAVAYATSPGSDVYYYLKESVQALLSGQNPYTYDYSGIPANLATPGAGHLFAYLPVTFLYLAPFGAVGDVRLGLVAADLFVASALFLYGGRWRRAAVTVFLFAPFTVLFATVYPDASLAAMPFVAFFFVFESRGRGLTGAVCYGLALAASQFAALMLPLVFLFYLRRGRWAEPLLSLAVGGAVIAPFLFSAPSAFLDGTAIFQFQRAVSPLFSTGGPFGFSLNPSVSAIVAWSLGLGLPFYAKAAADAAVLALLVRVRDVSSLARSTAVFLAASAFILPDDFFWAYLELPFMLGLFWLSAPADIILARDA